MPRTTSPPPRAALVALTTGVAVLALAACASTNGSGTVGPAQPAPAATATATPAEPSTAQPTAAQPTAAQPTAAQPTTAAAPATAGAPAAAPSTAPAGAGQLPGVPAVTVNPTDVTKQPTVAAGTGTVGSGLVVRDLVTGTGAVAKAGDMVGVRYVGSIYKDGTVFDASWKRGTMPVSFPLTVGSATTQGVIGGFAYGIAGMRVGGRREIVIPPGPLGYDGGNPQAGIAADDALVFVVDLAATKAAS
jgi:peptidylprolyl isomerase